MLATCLSLFNAKVYFTILIVGLGLSIITTILTGPRR